MPGIKALIFLAVTAVFFACAGEVSKIIIKPEIAAPPDRPREERTILDYQGAAEGREIPGWVLRFLDQGNPGVETLEAYRNSYVFVAAHWGMNFKALGHWIQGFTAAQDFPRLAAVRIEERLLRTASLYPDDEYGDFFAALVKKASDAVYTGTVKADSFWIKQLYAEEDAPARERYVFFVLLTIDKSEFQNQVRALLADLSPLKPPSREQAAAINRLKETFFEGF
jgi:hypothetical protein